MSPLSIDHTVSLEELSKKSLKVILEIDELVKKISKKIAGLSPGDLLKKVWFEYVEAKTTNHEIKEINLLIHAIGYIQSVIVSVSPSGNEKLDEETWVNLKINIFELFNKLKWEYQLYKVTDLKLRNPSLSFDDYSYKFLSEFRWINNRGKRYQYHEKQALQDFLYPHSDILFELFNINAQTLVDELIKLLDHHTFFAENLGKDINVISEKSSDFFDKLLQSDKNLDINKACYSAAVESGMQESMQNIYNFFNTLDFFDIEKITKIPRELLELLSYSPGEEEEFFQGETCQGWPTRLWPIMARPFIKLDNRILCFDIYSLFDYLPRVILRLTRDRLDKTEKNALNIRLSTYFESLSANYFKKILSDATIYSTDLFYGEDGQIDGLVFYENHLFVLETKSGGFTYTSPYHDFEAHEESLKILIDKGMEQVERFLEYLAKNTEVSIYSEKTQKESSLLFTLRHSDFRHITACVVTLDSIISIGSRAQYLPKFIYQNKHPVLVLSIDDLRVYADLFTNPLIFLHFIEQRIIACRSNILDSFDEMEYIGLYFFNNNYNLSAQEFYYKKKGGEIFLHKYRQPIDEYYYRLLFKENVPLPKNDMPVRFAEFIECLNTLSTAKSRAQLASILLDLGDECRVSISDRLDELIALSLDFQPNKRTAYFIGSYFSIFATASLPSNSIGGAIYQTYINMMKCHINQAVFIAVEHNQQGAIVNLYWELLDLSKLTEQQIKEVSSEQL